MTSYIKRVALSTPQINYGEFPLNMNKASVLMYDYDLLLTDLMMLCIQKGNYLTLRNIVTIVRKTPWNAENSCERAADLAESMYVGLKKVENDQPFELPACMQLRVSRIFSAIHQGIMLMAEQWVEGLCLQNDAYKVRRLQKDMTNLQDYTTFMYLILHELGCSYGDTTYGNMRCEAATRLTDALEAVDKWLDKYAPKDNG